MGLFDLFNDAKDNMDKRRQAQEYLQRARELVREGNEIYETAYEKVSAYAFETQLRIQKHTNYKNEIAKELGGNIGTTLQKFQDFNIDKKTIETPMAITTPSLYESKTGESMFASAVTDCLPRIEMPSIFNMFISEDDYYAARNQRDEAKLYKERMRMEREKLNAYKEKMGEIRSFMDSEKNVLSSLMSKLRGMTDELSNSMQQDSFTTEKANYLKGIHAIAGKIVTLLSTQFLTESFNINQGYREIFEAIEEVDQNLPSVPSITDANTAATLKRIFELS
jgi:hypothetical protein